MIAKIPVDECGSDCPYWRDDSYEPYNQVNPAWKACIHADCPDPDIVYRKVSDGFPTECPLRPKRKSKRRMDMGLDVTAYSKLKFVSGDRDGASVAGTRSVWLPVIGSFPVQGSGVYSYGRCYGFRAGSYSEYGNWREALAELAGDPEYTGEEEDIYGHPRCMIAWHGRNMEDRPFYPLINLRDCEGRICAEVSDTLHADFRKHALAARTRDERFQEVYRHFSRAFALARYGGAVVFH